MRFFVFNRICYERPTANAVNTIHTCAALAHLGARVVIFADLGHSSPESILLAAGTEPGWNLSLRQMGAGYHMAALSAVAHSVLRKVGSESHVAIFSEVRRYVPSLMEKARRQGFLIAFEAHNAAGLMAEDAAFAGRRAALEAEILSKVDLLIAPHRRTLQAIGGLLPAGASTIVLPNGAQFVKYQEPGNKEIDVLYAGDLSPWKGVNTLVAAMPLLKPYVLTILGGRVERDREALQALARRLGCADRIRFLPPVPPIEVRGYYARARVGVVPLNAAFIEAREFTCPVKLMEMMGAGLPIVAARLPSIQEFVSEGKEVLMARSDDPVEFAAGIRRLLENPDLAARLAAAAHAKAVEFSFERRAERLIGAVRDRLDGAGPENRPLRGQTVPRSPQHGVTYSRS